MVAFAHVSNVLGSILDAKRAADLAHAVGAKLLLDGCQAVPRLPVDVAAIDCDFYVFSGHKLYGPTGIGALWARAELLDCDAAVAGRRGDDRPGHFREDHLRARAAAVRGRHPADRRGDRARRRDRLYRRASASTRSTLTRRALVGQCRDALRAINDVSLFGPEDSAGIVSFARRRHSSARSRHHIGRGERRDPRRAPLRAAADGPARRPGHRAGQLRAHSDEATSPRCCAGSRK